jgi:hypothetical protein
MKIIVLVVCGLVFFACQKDSLDLGSDYQNIIGVWQENDGEAKSLYEFKTSGKFIFKSGLDRGYSRKIVRFTFIEHDLNSGWKRYAIGNNEDYYMSIFVSPMKDSIWAGGLVTDGASIQQQTKQYYIKVQ